MLNRLYEITMTNGNARTNTYWETEYNKLTNILNKVGMGSVG